MRAFKIKDRREEHSGIRFPSFPGSYRPAGCASPAEANSPTPAKDRRAGSSAAVLFVVSRQVSSPPGPFRCAPPCSGSAPPRRTGRKRPHRGTAPRRSDGKNERRASGAPTPPEAASPERHRSSGRRDAPTARADTRCPPPKGQRAPIGRHPPPSPPPAAAPCLKRDRTPESPAAAFRSGTVPKETFPAGTRAGRPRKRAGRTGRRGPPAKASKQQHRLSLPCRQKGGILRPALRTGKCSIPPGGADCQGFPNNSLSKNLSNCYHLFQ